MKNVLKKRAKEARRKAEIAKIICTMIMILSAIVAAVAITVTFISAFITTVPDMSIVSIAMVILFIISAMIEKYFLSRYYNAKRKYMAYTSC